MTTKETAPMNKESNSKSTAGGVGFLGLLTVAFIVLKLTGVIGWSWWLVLLPLWGPAALVVAVLIIVLVAILVRETMAAYKKQARARAKAEQAGRQAEVYGVMRRPGETTPHLTDRTKQAASMAGQNSVQAMIKRLEAVQGVKSIVIFTEQQTLTMHIRATLEDRGTSEQTMADLKRVASATVPAFWRVHIEEVQP